MHEREISGVGEQRRTRRPEPTAAPTGYDLLSLQRLAGNRAVAGRLAASSLEAGLVARMDVEIDELTSNVRVRDQQQPPAPGLEDLVKETASHVKGGADRPGPDVLPAGGHAPIEQEE